MNEEVILKIGGKKYGGWKQVAIEKSLYQITGTFGFSSTDVYPGDAEKWGIAMGDSCEVEVNGQTLITGYIEDIPISYDAAGHNIQISGRDKTGDLVDCPFILSANSWKNQTVLHIIKALCKPFGVLPNPAGIEVVADDSVAGEVAIRTKNFKYNEGETVFETIRRLIGHHALLAISHGNGKLTLTRAGTTRTNDTLELGRNVLSGNIEQSDKERFSTYIAKGQGASDDFASGKAVVEPSGRFEDEVVLRYRPFVIQVDGKADEGKCKKRAEWESRNRAGNSRRVEYVVQGWTQSNGEVWPLNALVPVIDGFLGINSTLLIARLGFTIDDSGTFTSMSLVDPESFKLLATPIKTMKTEFDWKA